MNFKTRIEKLEDQVAQQEQCSACGGQHTRNWVEMTRAVLEKTVVCTCRPCCAWVADLEASALADPTPLRRQHFTDPKGR